MNARSSKLQFMACIGSAALVLCANVAFAEKIEKRAPADPRGEVEIVNVAGAVRVTGWDRAEVDVRGDLDTAVERLEFVTTGNHTTIRVVLPRNRSRSGGSDLLVRIPEFSTLRVNTVSADQTIEGVRGVQRLQAVSGSVQTEAAGEEIQAKTISGDVRITSTNDAKPAIHTVTTVSGDIRLVNIAGEIEVETVSGDMKIDAGELARTRLRTTNGDIDIAARLPQNARVDAETINGDVTLQVIGKVDAEFNIHTFNGDIESCYEGEAVRRREHGPGRDLNFSRGSGSARVTIRTLNGGVEVCGK